MSESVVTSTNKLHALSEGIRRKHVRDADILAVAAESSAKKRKGNATSILNENAHPNKFDIGVHAKESTEVLPKLDVYNVTPHIPKLKAKKQKVTSPAKSPAKSMESSMPSTPVEIQNESNEYDFNEVSQSSITLDTSRVSSRRRSSLGSVDSDATGVMTLTDLRDILMDHLLRIVNTGTFEELLALKCIGKARATEIMTERNSGVVFETLYDLDIIGMNEKTIKKFITNNLLQILAV